MRRGRRSHEGPAWLNLVAFVLTDTPRLHGGLCIGRGSLFDGDGKDGPRTAQAVSTCHQCPALDPCSEWLATLPRTSKPTGVVAGRYSGPLRADGADQ